MKPSSPEDVLEVEHMTQTQAAILTKELTEKARRPFCDAHGCTNGAKWLLESVTPERVYRRACDQHRTSKRQCYVYKLIGVETGSTKERPRILERELDEEDQY
jgi:hypothetical protein